MRHPIRALVISALAVSLAAAGCSRNEGTESKGTEEFKQTKVILDTKGEAKTPAAEVDGAKKGGNITVFQDGDFEHLDPQQIYVSNSGAVAQQLIYRTLTTYVEDPDGGDLKLVGDLATNTGESSDDSKVWTYTLRDGIKFEDGTPITSKDIAYGIARSFSQFGENGPQYLQAWLGGTDAYKGPYNGGAAAPPGVETPDDKTIKFTFAEPHPDMPFVGSLQTVVPVPKAKDTKEQYETTFVSAGPYKLKAGGYLKDKSMVLEKNPNWDPSTDASRHQYVDTFTWDFTQNAQSISNRLLADSGGDQTGVQIGAVPPELVSKVRNDADAKDRILEGPTQYSWYMALNTQRITDLKVRRALNYAFDKDAYIKALGGTTAGVPSTTTVAPTQPGYKKFDAYPGTPITGDVEKAKEQLGSTAPPTLTHCFANTPTRQKAAATVKLGLEKAGFKIVLNPVDRASYYTTVGRKNTTCDLIIAGWGADYPDNSTVIPPLYDGTTIKEEGNQNYSYFNNDEINAKIKELSAEPDREKAAGEYMALDEKIQKDFAPIIPIHYDVNYTLYGSKVGGMYMTPNYGQASYLNLYVK